MANTPKPAEKPKTKDSMNIKKLILISVGVLIALVVLLLVVVNSATRGEVKVSNEFLNAVQARQTSVAFGLFSSDAQKATPQDKLGSAIDQIGPILNTQEKMVSKEVNSQSGSSSTGKVVYEIKGTDGVTYTITVELVKENGSWKVTTFDSKRK